MHIQEHANNYRNLHSGNFHVACAARKIFVSMARSDLLPVQDEPHPNEQAVRDLTDLHIPPSSFLSFPFDSDCKMRLRL